MCFAINKLTSQKIVINSGLWLDMVHDCNTCIKIRWIVNVLLLMFKCILGVTKIKVTKQYRNVPPAAKESNKAFQKPMLLL